MTEKEQSFGANLKKLRKDAGYTRRQLAQKLAYSAKAIEKWEAGSSFPPITTVCMLAELFGVTTDELIYMRKEED